MDANYSKVISCLKGQFSRFFLIVIYRDRGHHFNNLEMKAFLDLIGVSLIFSSSGVSKSIDMIKRGNRILKEVFTRGLEKWDRGLAKSVYVINSRII